MVLQRSHSKFFEMFSTGNALIFSCISLILFLFLYEAQILSLNTNIEKDETIVEINRKDCSNRVEKVITPELYTSPLSSNAYLQIENNRLKNSIALLNKQLQEKELKQNTESATSTRFQQNEESASLQELIQQKNEQLLEKIRSLKEQIKKLETENQQLRTDADITKEASVNIQLQIDEANNKIKQAESTIFQKNKESASLQELIQQKNDQLSASNITISQLQEKIGSMENLIKTIEEENQQLRTDADKEKKFNLELNTEIENAKAFELNSLHKNLYNTEQELLKTKRTLGGEIDLLKEKISTLEESLKNNDDKETINKLSTQLGAMNRLSQQLNEEKENLKNTFNQEQLTSKDLKNKLYNLKKFVFCLS